MVPGIEKLKREDYAKEVARKLLWATEQERQAKDHRDEVRDEFISVVNKGFKGRDHVLPVKTIEVPDEFWDKTGMTEEEFVESRFPGWNVEHLEKNIALGHTVFVLKRNPAYMPAVVEAEDGEKTIKVSKEIAEYVPEIDWETLMAERPDLFSKLADPKIVIDLNEEALEKLAEESPEALAILERHLKVKKPAVKTRALRVKDDK